MGKAGNSKKGKIRYNWDLDLLLFSQFFIVHKLLRDLFRYEFKGRNLGDLLDVGCGNKPFRKFIKFKTYTGIEIEKNENVDVLYDGNSILFPDETFDTVLCTDVLEHVCETNQFIGEMVRVLRAGGELILTTNFFWNLHYEPNDYYRFTKYGLTYLFLKNDLEVKKIVPLLGWVGLAQGLFADRLSSFIHTTFRIFPEKLRILFYQIFLLPTALLVYPVARYEFCRDGAIKSGYFIIGAKSCMNSDGARHRESEGNLGA